MTIDGEWDRTQTFSLDKMPDAPNRKHARDAKFKSHMKAAMPIKPPAWKTTTRSSEAHRVP